MDPESHPELDAPRPTPARAPAGEPPRSRSRPCERTRRHERAMPAPRPSRGSSVKLEGLRAFYGDAEQVKGIDLEFRANEVTAIIGPSGCGKSTMVRCINRMHEEIPGARAEGRVLLEDARRVRPVGRRRRGAPGDRHGLPEAQPVPDDVDLRQRRRRPAPELATARRPATRRSRRRCAARACGTRSPTASASRAPGSPAASSSACASRARWPSTPR